MPDRAEMLDTIRKAYDARVAGDAAGLLSHFAPDATYCLSGQAIAPGMPTGEVEAAPALQGLVQTFRFENLRKLSAMVDGDTAVMTWQVDVSVNGKDRVTSEFCDFWKFGEDGKVTSLQQFVDTALVKKLLA